MNIALARPAASKKGLQASTGKPLEHSFDPGSFEAPTISAVPADWTQPVAQRRGPSGRKFGGSLRAFIAFSSRQAMAATRSASSPNIHCGGRAAVMM